MTVSRKGDAAVFTGDLMHSPLQARYPELFIRADVSAARDLTRGSRFAGAISPIEVFAVPSIARSRFRCGFGEQLARYRPRRNPAKREAGLVGAAGLEPATR